MLKWLTLSLFAYVGALIFAKISWGEALSGILIPHVQWSSSFLTRLVAILGTTISPYLFFWQASQEAEDQRVDAKKSPLAEKHYGAEKEFLRIRVDTIVGMAFSNLIAISIIITAAATHHATGKTNIETSAQAAEALRPVAGAFAEFIFAMGIIGTGLLAVPVLAGSAAYANGEGRNGPWVSRASHVRPFHSTQSGTICGNRYRAEFHADQSITALYWSAVVNGVLAIPVMVLLMFLARRKT